MAAPRPYLMEEMTWEEVRDAAAAGLPAVVGIGSTEQHGPHLPLNTDAVIPTEIALAAAQITPMVVAPPIHYGSMSRPLSGGGERFPGTVSLRAATLIATVTEVLLGLAKSGFTDLCLFNWHYENAAHLWEAADLAVAARDGIRVLVMEHPLPQFSEQELSELFPGGFTGWNFEHASNLETSMMYVLRPGLVRRDKIADDHAERAPDWDVVPAPDEFIPRSGVLMKPTEATEEAGQRFFDASVNRLVTAVRTEFGRP
jgi:creatinine amidohydrolase